MKIDFKFTVFFLLLIFLLSSAFFLKVGRYGDASTYYLITQSIVYDGDIKYEQKDLLRVLERPFEDVPAGLFLIKNHQDGNYYYAKGYLYSLFSSPFFLFFGVRGFLVFNALMLWVMIYLSYDFLSRKTDTNAAILFSLIFFIFSLPFVYVYWVHSDLFCMFWVFLSFYFWFRDTRKGSKISLANIRIDMRLVEEVAACIFMGMATYERLPCIILSSGFFIEKLLDRDLKGVVRSAFFVALPPIILFGAYYLVTGALHDHSGDRYYYTTKFPFMDGCNFENECGKGAFSLDRNDISYDVHSKFSILGSISIFPQILFNYFFGRYAGILLYNFPILLSLTAMKIDRKRVIVLISVAAFIFYYCLTQQTNYAGLGHAVGNRYFYAYPAFIFLVDKIKLNKKFLALSMIVLVLGFQLFSDPVTNSKDPVLHTRNFPYSIFPLELSMMPLMMGSVRYNNTFYYFDGAFYNVERNGAWLKGRSSGTIFITSSGQKEINLSVELESYLCPVNIEISTGNSRKLLNLGNKNKTVVVIESSPVFYSPNSNASVYAVKFSSDNGCRPSEVTLSNKSTLDSGDRNLDDRYLSVFVKYPVKMIR